MWFKCLVLIVSKRRDKGLDRRGCFVISLGTGHYLQGGGGGGESYEIGKLRVRNSCSPPPPSRQGKTYKRWKPFKTPISMDKASSSCVKTDTKDVCVPPFSMAKPFDPPLFCPMDTTLLPPSPCRCVTPLFVINDRSLKVMEWSLQSPHILVGKLPNFTRIDA